MNVLIDRDEQSYQLEVELFTPAKSNLLRDLQDSPLNDTQTLVEVDEGVWRLSATVKRTVQLRNWLLALGAQAKVCGPQQIRDDLISYLSTVQKHYA